MDLLKLKYFYTVAKYENVSSASKELLISQSALSKAIRTLEDELRMDLFYRSGKRISLNKNGEFLFTRVKQIFKELQYLEKALIEHREEDNGSLSIITTLPYIFTNLVDSFMEKYPNIHYQQVSLSKENLYNFIENGRYDICISASEFTHPNIKWIPLFEEEIFLTVPSTFPISNFNEIDLQHFKDTPFIGLSTNYSYRQFTDSLCLRYNFVPKYRVEVEEATTILQLIKNGKGVSFTPHTAIDLSEEKLKHLRIKNGPFTRKIGLLQHNNTYQAKIINKFIEHCHAYFKDIIKVQSK
ncbi:transcriptional regulator [Ureibacillus massiliensis 4400831 = CIP 108448 = CCUG 49529]|uniref:Transcriptional regulator n=1 Tax=Ureibacillus massiliensis 4400831 = CIP 108448 = CCUG 49529 TaxID=1211035 RepID=A0A0A3J4P8_9BACL|nr:LysR family transcriptional regulator [Ureibacillus massiliensis]KGR90148.1 transcriptional regulator [Ureibacillus massiliensis 4400831 = CIP 108448 = CCUG 49529]